MSIPNIKPAESLQQVVVETYALLVQTQNYHWNVKGPHFAALHAMFEDQYRALFEALDEIAERMRALGAVVEADLKFLQDHSALSKPNGKVDAMTMVKQLLDNHIMALKTIDQAFEVADRAKDDVTMDLMNERRAFHDKTIWMLRSTLES